MCIDPQSTCPESEIKFFYYYFVFLTNVIEYEYDS